MFATKYKLLVLQLLYVDNRFQIQLTIHTLSTCMYTMADSFRKTVLMSIPWAVGDSNLYSESDRYMVSTQLLCQPRLTVNSCFVYKVVGGS